MKTTIKISFVSLCVGTSRSINRIRHQALGHEREWYYCTWMTWPSVLFWCRIRLEVNVLRYTKWHTHLKGQYIIYQREKTQCERERETSERRREKPGVRGSCDGKRTRELQSGNSRVCYGGQAEGWSFTSKTIQNTKIKTALCDKFLSFGDVPWLRAIPSGYHIGSNKCLTRNHPSLSSPTCTTISSPFLGRARLRLQLDELLGDLVVGALGKDAEDGEARLVHVHTRPQGAPAGTAALLRYVSQLHDSHAHHAVRAAEAVVLHTHLQLVGLRTVLITQNAIHIEKTRSYKLNWWPRKQQLKMSWYIFSSLLKFS